MDHIFGLRKNARFVITTTMGTGTGGPPPFPRYVGNHLFNLLLLPIWTAQTVGPDIFPSVNHFHHFRSNAPLSSCNWEVLRTRYTISPTSINKLQNYDKTYQKIRRCIQKLLLHNLTGKTPHTSPGTVSIPTEGNSCQENR